MTPVTPPIVKIGMKPTAYSMGTVNSIFPFHIVKIQLKILIPVGIAIAMVVIEKILFVSGPCPIVKKWWVQTKNEKNEMITIDPTIDL